MAGAFLASMLHVALRLAVLPIVALAMNPSLPLGKLVLWPLVFLYGGAVAPAPGGTVERWSSASSSRSAA